MVKKRKRIRGEDIETSYSTVYGFQKLAINRKGCKKVTQHFYKLRERSQRKGR